MAQDHLQLHGQPGGNGKESSGGSMGRDGRSSLSWLQFPGTEDEKQSPCRSGVPLAGPQDFMSTEHSKCGLFKVVVSTGRRLGNRTGEELSGHIGRQNGWQWANPKILTTPTEAMARV